jgi:two-component system cell cycle response regulator
MMQTAPTRTTAVKDAIECGRGGERAALFVVRGPQQGAIFPLSPEQTLGRDESADLRLGDDAISRVHARVILRGGEVFVEDLGSRNGTTVRGEALRGTTRLEDGDYVGLGPVTLLKFRMMDDLELGALRRLHESTLRDPLTRLYNRRYFDERLRTEFSFTERHGASLAVLLIDIDHFKRVNDTHGHRAGDFVLQLVAATIQRIMRPEDVVARYGGEEFVVIARNTSERNAEIFAERIRKRIQQLSADWEGRELRVTASIGVTATNRHHKHPSIESMLESADEALYQAKRGGRNRVRTARSGPGEIIGFPDAQLADEPTRVA